MERLIRCAAYPLGRSVLHQRLFPVFILLVVFALLLLISCAGAQTQKSQAKGVYHIVKKGETAYSIARAYSISMQDLAEVNNISDASHIKEGSVVFIPDADQVIDDVMVSARKAGADVKRATGFKDQRGPGQAAAARPANSDPAAEKPPGEQDVSEPSGGAPTDAPSGPAAEKKKTRLEEKPFPAEKREEVKLEKGRLFWPVKGTVKTRFGIQPNKTYHNWIKITCPAGTKVRAAAGGTVIFSANLKDFGETIIIRHANDFATVYTHLKKRYVKADQNIKKGEAIALVGEIDEAGDAYINFEIRLKGKARNPLFYLP
ncbi:MAG: M23 family metallopeptidase [Deltaproteobacteria bacterium]